MCLIAVVFDGMDMVAEQRPVRSRMFGRVPRDLVASLVCTQAIHCMSGRDICDFMSDNISSYN